MRALACVVLLACGAKHEPKTHQVEIRAMQFVPATLTVNAGDTVVWTNRDVVPHTVTAAGAFDSQSIAGGQAWLHVVTGTGELTYGCTFHPTMTAKLTVR